MKKPSRVRRPKAPKMSEREFVRETVSKETRARFEVVAPHPAFPPAVDRLEWFMRRRDKDEIAKAPYLNAVWKEKGVGIWLESLAVGDTIDWIELAYGDERAGESLDIDYSHFDEEPFQEDFKRKFPLVLGRIREYEQAAEEVSKRRKVRLELRRAGSKGMLVFTVAARVVVRKGASQAVLGNALGKNVSALKAAYERIAKL